MSVDFTINGHTTPLGAGESLFDAAERLGVCVPSSCRKQGKCRECLVEVVAGREQLSPPTSEESHLKGDFRLSCRCHAAPGAAGQVRAHTLRRAALQIEGGAVNLPAHRRATKPDPAVTRDGDRVLLDGVEIDRRTGPLHGLAMDLGTTTVVVRCVDLETGAIIATASIENPQRFGGTDVMARIQFDTEHPGRLLQRTLLGYLGRALAEFPVEPHSIYEFVIAGNSTMRDLFFGLDVHSIGQKPYWSTTEHAFRTGESSTTAVAVTAKQLRLPIHPEARIYGLPLVGGHVGADAAACLLALEPHRSDEFVAIMDIGTNTELFMGNRHGLLAASCPAGPAFEGRAIACGMPGLDGAIARIALDAGGVAQIGVIGGGAPEGICGSGLIDLLGELLRTGRMNAYGRFADGEDAFTVDAAHGIVFRESDVNELAQAKGANVAGLLVVAKRAGRSLGQLDRFYLAGGFGRHLDLAAARRIGLIPDLPDGRIVSVGNAAIEGATIALLSVSRRRELEELVKSIAHVELETDPGFFDHFVEGCQFRPIGAPAEVPA
jgi:uncharacterized 2Fe-2S/4Fe-4S cluster protein (DUF4445 family)